jgi:hypothetical protein
MNDAWETDESDTNIDEEEPLSTFEGLAKGFLLAKPPDRKNRKPTPLQQAEQPPQRTQSAPEKQAKRPLKEEILQEIR